MKKIKRKKLKVIIAMSGGIDSSVAAALLKQKGCKVIGVFMKLWSEPGKNGLVGIPNRCCSLEAEKRVRLVAKKLGIPFYVFNFEKEFKKKIVDYFLNEIKKGKTPNPCVVCNKEIKFGLLLKKALPLNTDFTATGHYARRKVSSSKYEQVLRKRVQVLDYKLLKGKDKNKDQSYFLWQLDQKQLKRILFPVGDYTKNQVRSLAKKFKLPIFEVPESQEICFVQTTINDFLKKHLKPKPGNIVDKSGKILGKHFGLYFYTIGQRRGIRLPGGPYFVLDKDVKNNLLIVTKNERVLYKKELIAKDINWIFDEAPKLPLKVKAKIRYGHKAALATISKQRNNRIKVVFSKSQRAITLGQSVVFYKGQEVLGGGVIE